MAQQCNFPAFRFLDLPRELRNDIYEYYTEDSQFEVSYPVVETAKSESCMFQTRMFGALWRWRPALAYTCLQVFAKYRQEILRKTVSMVHAFYIDASDADDLSAWTTASADAVSIPQATLLRLYIDMYKISSLNCSKYLDQVLKCVAMFECLRHLELEVSIPSSSCKTIFLGTLLNSLKMLPVYTGQKTKALLDVTVSFHGEEQDRLVRAMADGVLIWL
jgi:hypothetical protein